MPFMEFGDYEEKLNESLAACRNVAEKSEVLARDMVDIIRNESELSARYIGRTISDIKSLNIRDEKTERGLANELYEVRNELEQLPERLNGEIDVLAGDKTSFSITLFGRTMAGKSTLMEILTRGKGDSIGQGGQRTTRSVSDHYYKGIKELKVTDVPGVDAFGGKEDEEKAFEAARKSNLIIFLINNDPMPSEAEWMSKVMELGKPVICLININMGIEDVNDDMAFKIFENDLRDKFAKEKIFKLINQFRDFGRPYGQDWRRIKFICVHLWSEFLALREDTPYRLKARLHRLSRFSRFEEALFKEISYNGPFYKLKTYTDIIAAPFSETLIKWFSRSERYSILGQIFIKKKEEIEKWRDKEFLLNARNEIAGFISRTKSDLAVEANGIAEKYLDLSEKEINEKWREKVKEYDMGAKGVKVLENLREQCRDYLSEVQRDLDYELGSLGGDFKDIDKDLFIDWKFVSRVTLILAGGLALLLEPAIIPFVVIGALEIIVESVVMGRNARIAKAKRKLRDKLVKSINEPIDNMGDDMWRLMRRKIIEGEINATAFVVNESVTSFFRLTEDQLQAARRLNCQMRALNLALVTSALNYKDFGESADCIDKIARIPGRALILVVKKDRKLPDGLRRELSSLLQEKVRIVPETEKHGSMIHKILGEGSNVRIQWVDDKPLIARIGSFDEFDAQDMMKVRLAQQLTELLMMNAKNGGMS